MVSEELESAICRAAGTRIIGATLGSEIDLWIDTAKSSNSFADAIAFTQPRGRVVLLGVPNQANINLAALWHRKTELVSAYCYGNEDP